MRTGEDRAVRRIETFPQRYMDRIEQACVIGEAAARIGRLGEQARAIQVHSDAALACFGRNALHRSEVEHYVAEAAHRRFDRDRADFGQHAATCGP